MPSPASRPPVSRATFPGQAPRLAADLRRSTEAARRPPCHVRHHPADLRIEDHGLRLAPDRPFALDLVAVAAALDARAPEQQLRINGHIEEIRAPEVRVAGLHARFDAGSVNIRHDRGMIRVFLVEVDLRREDLRNWPRTVRHHHVLDGEFDLGIGPVPGYHCLISSSPPCSRCSRGPVIGSFTKQLTASMSCSSNDLQEGSGGPFDGAADRRRGRGGRSPAMAASTSSGQPHPPLRPI